jgi:hypothetical protein
MESSTDGVVILDPPSPFAPVEEWVQFNDELLEVGADVDDYVWPLGLEPRRKVQAHDHP